MKYPSIIISLIVGGSLVISAALVASAVKEYGHSMERAATNQPRLAPIPPHIKVFLEGGGSPVRLDVNSKP